MTDFEQHPKPTPAGHTDLSSLSLWQDLGSGLIQEGRFDPTELILDMSFQGPDIDPPKWEGNLLRRTCESTPDLNPAVTAPSVMVSTRRG